MNPNDPSAAEAQPAAHLIAVDPSSTASNLGCPILSITAHARGAGLSKLDLHSAACATTTTDTPTRIMASISSEGNSPAADDVGFIMEQCSCSRRKAASALKVGTTCALLLTEL